MSQPARKSAPVKKAAAKRAKKSAKAAPALAPKKRYSTGQRDRFICEYLRDQSGPGAAIRAGYSARSAPSTAARLLADPRIKAQIDQGLAGIRAKAEQETTVSLSKVLREIGSLALYDAGEIGKVSIKGPADIQKLPEIVRRAVIGWSWDKAGNFTLKLASKTPNLDMLMKHLGGYEKDNAQRTDPLKELMAMVWGQGSTLPLATDEGTKA